MIQAKSRIYSLSLRQVSTSLVVQDTNFLFWLIKSIRKSTHLLWKLAQFKFPVNASLLAFLPNPCSAVFFLAYETNKRLIKRVK